MTARPPSLSNDKFAIPSGWELFYDLFALSLVLAFAQRFFWIFVIVIGPALLGSIALMTVEHFIIQSDKAAAARKPSA